MIECFVPYWLWAMCVQGVPTEREVHTEKFSDPVYRVMLSAVSGQVPQLSGQVEDKSDV